MRPYFGGAPNAFAGGAEYSDHKYRNAQADNALNAMIQRFGPEAADPTRFGQMQSIRQNEQLFPHVLGQAERDTNANQALVTQYGPIAGSPSAYGTQQTENSNLFRTGKAAASVLQRVKENGGDLGGAFDRIMPILKAMGMPPEQFSTIRAQLLENPDLVDELSAMLTAGSADGGPRGLSGGQAMYDSDGRLKWVIPMTDGSIRQVDGFTPAGALHSEARIDQGNANINLRGRTLTLAEARAYGLGTDAQWSVIGTDPSTGQPIFSQTMQPGSVGEEERLERIEKRQAADQAVVARNESLADRYTRGQQFASGGLMRMREVGPFLRSQNLVSGALRKSMAARPGNVLYDIQRYFDSLAGVIAIDQLLAIKTAGATLGQVTERELDMLQSQLGSWDIGRDPEQLEADLRELIATFGRFTESFARDAQQARERMNNPSAYGIQPNNVPMSTVPGGAPAPAPAPAQGPQDLSGASDDDLWGIFGGQR
jgi:hypothetical protein